VRALALLFISDAFIEGTYLPERLFAFSHYVTERDATVEMVEELPGIALKR
jgi:hypothetical protein